MWAPKSLQMVTAAVKMKGACSLEGEPGPACGAAGGSDVQLSAAPWVAAHGLLCPWDSPGKNTGVGCHFLLQGIFMTLGLNSGLLHFRQILYHLSHPGSSMTNLDSVLKSRDITLPTKFHIINAMVFAVVRYGCESWTIKEGRVPKN